MKSDYINSSLNFSLLALDNSDIDCVIAGAVNTTSDVVRSAIRIIGLKKATKCLSSVFLCYLLIIIIFIHIQIVE